MDLCFARWPLCGVWNNGLSGYCWQTWQRGREVQKSDSNTPWSIPVMTRSRAGEVKVTEMRPHLRRGDRNRNRPRWSGCDRKWAQRMKRNELQRKAVAAQSVSPCSVSAFSVQPCDVWATLRANSSIACSREGVPQNQRGSTRLDRG